MPVIRTGRIVKLLEQRAERGLVLQGQPDRQMQYIRGREPRYGLQVQVLYNRRNVAAQHLSLG